MSRGKRRKDEVGEIARAVTVLQRSMKEREKLRGDVADIEQVWAEKLRLEKASLLCQAEIHRRLLAISDLNEKIELDCMRLSSNSGLAEGEADETRLVIMRAFKPDEKSLSMQKSKDLAGEMIGSIDRLSETIGTLSRDVITLNDSVGLSGQKMEELERLVANFSRTLTEKNSNKVSTGGLALQDV